jgi:hypothetical protein
MKARRGIAVLVASIVAVTVTLVATAVPASADSIGIPTDTPMRLINYNSFRCVQPVAGNGVASWDDGAPIQQLTCGDNVPNYWTAHYMGSLSLGVCFSSPWQFCDDHVNVYQFSSNFSGKCLDISVESTAPWTPMTQRTCTPGDLSTYWYLTSGDFYGTYILRNFYSRLCLDVYGASTEVGATIQQWTCTSQNVAQNFYYT